MGLGEFQRVTVSSTMGYKYGVGWDANVDNFMDDLIEHC